MDWDALLGPPIHSRAHKRAERRDKLRLPDSSSESEAMEEDPAAADEDESVRRANEERAGSDDDGGGSTLLGSTGPSQGSHISIQRPVFIKKETSPTTTPISALSTSGPALSLRSPVSPEPSPPPPDPAALKDFMAFLNAYAPTHDWTATSAAFVQIGLSCPVLLVDLLHLDQRYLRIVLKRISKKANLGGLELARLKKVLRDAKEELRLKEELDAKAE
jgi:hypothetical protein